VELILFIGIQASGKSTFYKERFFSTHIRINLDMLKTRAREDVVLHACLAAKQPIVIDNTNVTRAQRAKYISLARAAGFEVSGYFFETTLEDAIARNRRRTGKQCIPERGLLGTFRKLERPTLDEGFDSLSVVRMAQNQTFSVTQQVR
jgi:predicted kinase